MTTNDAQVNEQPTKKKTREITFQCKSCGKFKRIEEMRVLTRFFPLLIVCKDCEQKML